MRRFKAFILCLAFTAVLCCGMVGASTRASNYLNSYGATLSTGNSSGQLQLNWNVTAKRPITSIGISSIAVYTADGEYVKSITGTQGNGLTFSSGIDHSGTYNLSLTAGRSYYLSVCFFAKDASGGDSKYYTTGTATAAR